MDRMKAQERDGSHRIQMLEWIQDEYKIPIFSLDTQPGHHRIATAGADHSVRIWGTSQISLAEPGTLISTIEEHRSSVNCVRWSKSGRQLASASDDTVVLVHQMRDADPENWGTVAALRGHISDVVDLDWSPADAMLASCSSDGTVRVWDARVGVAVTVAVLEHGCFVKGLAWDPMGEFIVSQVVDGSVAVWRTADWSLLARITVDVWEKEGNSLFTRPSWSPCGQILTAPRPAGCADAHGQHTAPLLARSDLRRPWSHLTGHSERVSVARFNHAMFRDAANPGQPAYGVVAVGGQDGCLSVWTTQSPPRRVLSGKGVFLRGDWGDFAWSSDGHHLLGCCVDGSVAMVAFLVGELGEKVVLNSIASSSSEMGSSCELQIAAAAAANSPLLQSTSPETLTHPDFLVEEQVGHMHASGMTGTPIATAANSFFSAAAMRCGTVHLYIRACPSNSRGPVCRTMTFVEAEWGEEVASMACNEGCWDLLLCTSHGHIYIWDLTDEPRCTLEENLLSYPYLLSSVGVACVRLSETAEPVIAFEDGSQCVFRCKLKSWVRVPRREVTVGIRSTVDPAGYGSSSTRRIMEGEVIEASSAQEYRQSLASYASLLMETSDETRLRSVCEDLLGWAGFQPDMHPGLGLSRQSVLREDVLPVMVDSPSQQGRRLAQEFNELVSERPLLEVLAHESTTRQEDPWT